MGDEDRMRALRDLFPPWRVVSSKGRTRREAARKWAADVLVRLAHRLDPARSTVTTGPDGSYTVALGRTPLARIEPGMIRDTRTVHRG